MARTKPNEAGCWLWQGARSSKGYGSVRYSGRAIGAHRLSWLLHKGPIPDGLHVLHSCDTPACLNPEHLFLGSNQDNVTDKIAKGRLRVPSGAEHYMRRLPVGHPRPERRKLDEAQKACARFLSVFGAQQRDIGAWLGVSQAVIWRIVTKEAAHV